MLLPFGTKRRSIRLWHSLVPFSQEEYGWVKYTAVLQEGQACKLRAVVAGNRFEHLIALLCEVGQNLLERFGNGSGSMIASLDPDAHPCHALHQSQNARLGCILFADDRIDLPMTEFRSKVHDFGSFFDASTEISLVSADFFGFRIATEFLRQVDIFDEEQTQIHIIVERLGADSLLAEKCSAFACCTDAGVQRPFVLVSEMLDNILKEAYRCQAAVLLAAILAAFRTHLPALVGFISLHFAVIERYRSAPDLIPDRVVRTSQMSCDAVDRPAVLQPNFNFVPLFA